MRKLKKNVISATMTSFETLIDILQRKIVEKGSFNTSGPIGIYRFNMIQISGVQINILSAALA